MPKKQYFGEGISLFLVGLLLPLWETFSAAAAHHSPPRRADIADGVGNRMTASMVMLGAYAKGSDKQLDEGGPAWG